MKKGVYTKNLTHSLGAEIIGMEKSIDAAFAQRNVTSESLRAKVAQSAEIYGWLRFVHLNAHLAMIDILTPEQIQKYNDLRGYTSGDPCKDIPPGHDPQMWRTHHRCP